MRSVLLTFAFHCFVGYLACRVDAATLEILGFTDPYSEKSIHVSDDGSVVLSGYGGSSTPRPFLWRVDAGIVKYYEYDDLSPRGLSGDGKVILGYRYPSLSSTTDASYDGSVIVGNRSKGYPHIEAFRSALNESPMGLGDLPGGEFGSKANAVSPNGTTVVGSSLGEDWFEPFRWTAEEGMIPLGPLPGASSSRGEAWDVSADGDTVVGGIRSPHGFEAFRWTSKTGIHGLGDLPGGSFSSSAYAVSSDGSTVVGGGTVEGFQGFDAFIWDEAQGMRSIKRMLAEEYGIDLPRLALWRATGISGNGRVIVGLGVQTSDTGARDAVAWRLDLGPIPEPSSGALFLVECCLLFLATRGSHRYTHPRRVQL